MTFLYLLSWVSVIIHVCFMTCAIAAFLYYLAELVEEYTVITGKIINYFIFISIGIYVCLFLFEEFPVSIIICGIITQVMHLLLLRTFPFCVLTSPPFIIAAIMLCVNHYLAFSHFAAIYYPFSEVLAYFTICLWLVPFSFFVSLSANENVLPTVAETKHLLSDDNDVVSNYFSRKSKRYGLLSFFNFAKDSILPQRVKKAF
ncbi:hypothetical protein CHUAL_008100 [Chamberlinius hualienensis]